MRNSPFGRVTKTTRLVQETLKLPARDACIAVVADTHSRLDRRAAELLRARAPVAIVHAGDVGALEVLDDLARIAPVIAVRGNIDTHADGLPDVVDIEVVWGRRRLCVVLTHIAVRGPRLRADARRLAAARGAHVVVCGHSHVPLVARDGPVTVFNPGSVGPRRFALPITFGVMSFDDEGLSFAHIDCATGAPWRPPASPGSGPLRAG